MFLCSRRIPFIRGHIGDHCSSRPGLRRPRAEPIEGTCLPSSLDHPRSPRQATPTTIVEPWRAFSTLQSEQGRAHSLRHASAPLHTFPAASLHPRHWGSTVQSPGPHGSLATAIRGTPPSPPLPPDATRRRHHWPPPAAAAASAGRAAPSARSRMCRWAPRASRSSSTSSTPWAQGRWRMQFACRRGRTQTSGWRSTQVGVAEQAGRLAAADGCRCAVLAASKTASRAATQPAHYWVQLRPPGALVLPSFSCCLCRSGVLQCRQRAVPSA